MNIVFQSDFIRVVRHRDRVVIQVETMQEHYEDFIVLPFGDDFEARDEQSTEEFAIRLAKSKIVLTQCCAN